eukprot:7387208-Prymnesium_polylepis.1
MAALCVVLSLSGLVLNLRPSSRLHRSPAVVMGGGIKQSRPSAPRTYDSLPQEAVADAVDVLPKLVVFDLDNTVWTPELYTLRHLRGYEAATSPNPVADEDVWLLDSALAAFHEMTTSPRWAQTKVAIASRTNKGPWAHALLQRCHCRLDLARSGCHISLPPQRNPQPGSDPLNPPPIAAALSCPRRMAKAGAWATSSPSLRYILGARHSILSASGRTAASLLRR